MSDRSEQTVQSPQTPDELGLRMLEMLNVGKKAIEEISDEELELVGGAGSLSIIGKGLNKFEKVGGWKYVGGAAISTIFMPSAKGSAAKAGS